jgi:hypothetical protein
MNIKYEESFSSAFEISPMKNPLMTTALWKNIFPFFSSH